MHAARAGRFAGVRISRTASAHGRLSGNRCSPQVGDSRQPVHAPNYRDTLKKSETRERLYRRRGAWLAGQGQDGSIVPFRHGRSVKNAKSPLAPTDRSPSVRWAHRSQADLVAHLITQSRNRAPPWRRAQGCGRRLWCTRPMAHAGRARALTRTLNGSAFAAIWRGGRPLHTCAAYECSQRGAEIRPALRPESRPDAATCGR